MNDTVKALVELGELDAKLGKLRREVESLPAGADEFRASLAEAEEALVGAGERTRELKLESDRKNLDLREIEGSLEKLQTQLNGAKSNKEYDLTREQMKEIEEKSSSLEEAVLEALEEIDQLEAAEADRQARVEGARTGLAEIEAEIAARVGELSSTLADMQARRDDMASRVDSEDLARYQRVLDNHGDTAVAAVEFDEGVCSACYMRLTKQQLNVVAAGRDIAQCQSCRRILYVPEPVT